MGARDEDRMMRTAPTPAAAATSSTTVATAGHRCRCWWVSTWVGSTPAARSRSSWAENSRWTSAGSMRPSAIRGRKERHDDGR
jgi:hypothetical protein